MKYILIVATLYILSVQTALASESGLKVRVQFNHDDEVCIKNGPGSCEGQYMKGNEGDVLVHEFSPGEIDVGDTVDVCFRSQEECHNLVNDPEREPLSISN